MTTKEKQTASLGLATAHIQEVIIELQSAKSLERTELDRRLAIAVTRAEELEAYIQYWLKPQ